jgi:diaminohydroxyphosphoribosylaminopyrimidine deaminase/5-amino-6-(5-phosphoribosylamino)uracil reductase
VVIGSVDDNPDVQGSGIDILKERGCEVVSGVLEEECRELNKRFITYHKKKRPYIILKWAQTKDGFIAPDPAKREWITGQLSKRLVHKWRTEEDAIFVGTNTVLVDNPVLTAREWDGKDPVRVLVDFNNRLDQKLQVFNNAADTLVYNHSLEEIRGKTKHIILAKEADSLESMMYDLYNRGISSIIVEGGKQILDSFVYKDLWDEARVFTGTGNFGKGLAAPVLECHPLEKEFIGDDELELYRNLN